MDQQNNRMKAKDEKDEQRTSEEAVQSDDTTFGYNSMDKINQAKKQMENADIAFKARQGKA